MVNNVLNMLITLFNFQGHLVQKKILFESKVWCFH